MISIKRFVPAVVVVLAAAVAGLHLAGWQAGMLTPLALLFMLICPGLPWLWTLEDIDPTIAVVAAVALSLAIEVLVSEAMIYLHVWSPAWAFVALTAIGFLGLLLGWRKGFWLMLAPDPRSLGAPSPRLADVASRHSYDAFRSTKYFPFLDGIRGISALAVITFHEKGHPFSFLRGSEGVIAFFVISGFLITTLALRQEERQKFVLASFYIRRVFRLLPLYYGALAIYTVLVIALHDSRSAQFFRDFPYFGLYLQEVPLIAFNTEAPFAHSWTLGIEEKFYIVWPLLAFVILMQRQSRTRLCAAGVIGLVAWRILDSGVVARLFYPYSFILVGCLLAFLLHDPIWFERLRKLVLPLRTTRGMSAATVVMLGVFLLPLGEGPGRFVSAAVFTIWLTIAVLHRGNSVGKYLARPTLLFLGRVSYAVYLFHSLFLVLMDKLLPDSDGLLVGTAKFVGCLVLLLPVCAAIHRWIETPCTDFGRGVARRFDR